MNVLRRCNCRQASNPPAVNNFVVSTSNLFSIAKTAVPRMILLWQIVNRHREFGIPGHCPTLLRVRKTTTVWSSIWIPNERVSSITCPNVHLSKVDMIVNRTMNMFKFTCRIRTASPKCTSSKISKSSPPGIITWALPNAFLWIIGQFRWWLVETVHMTFSTCLGKAYTKYCPLPSPNTTECFGVFHCFGGVVIITLNR